MTTTIQTQISPDEVHEILAQHVLKDGFDMVLDLEKSRGVWLYDSLHNRRYLDFFTSFASYPVGFSHPMLNNEQFKREILPAASGVLVTISSVNSPTPARSSSTFRSM